MPRQLCNFFLDHSVDSTVSYDGKFCSLPRCSVSASRLFKRYTCCHSICCETYSMSLTVGVTLEMARSNFLTLGQTSKNMFERELRPFCTFISLRLDYCNSLENGILVSDNLLRRLQAVQNAAARCYWYSMARTHHARLKATPVDILIEQRIEFKRAVLVYKTLNGLSPQYLADDSQLTTTTSRRDFHREVPRTRTSGAIDQSLLLDCFCGTSTWF